MRVYLIGPSLLVDVLSTEGQMVTCGWVINGQWLYVTSGETMLCYRDMDRPDLLNPVTAWPIVNHGFVLIPRGMFPWHEYNDAMTWARTQPETMDDMKAQLGADELARINAPKTSGFEDMDDDIPF